MLVAFVCDGVLSVVDAWMFDIGVVRDWLAGSTLLLAFVVHNVVMTTPRMSPWLMYPMTLFPGVAVVVTFAAYGFGTDLPVIDRWVALAQSGVGAVVALAAWRFGGLPIRSRANPAFTWRYAMGAAALNGLVFMPSFVGASVLLTRAIVEHHTRGFLSLGLDGIHILDRTYRNGADDVRVVGMMHIGDDGFYKGLVDSLPEGSIVLAEGVTDKNAWMAVGGPAVGMAEALGTANQHVFEDALRQRADVEVRRADLDMSDFSEATRMLLRAGATLIEQGDATALLELTGDPEAQNQIVESLRVDLLERRNAHLLDMLDIALVEADVVVLPWGAAHLPGIHDALGVRGFQAVSERSRVVLRWDSLGG